MNYTHVENLLEYCPELDANDMEGSYYLWQHYLKFRRSVYTHLVQDQLEHNLISEANWVLRAKFQSCESLGVEVAPGDICYMDFGQAYINEIGYQHFGLIMNICQKKALILPMTSNRTQYESAYDPVSNPNGKIHLMRIGQIPGLNRPSVLFLNDMKFVNTARVIDVKAHMETDSPLFRRVQQRMMMVMYRQ